MKRLLSAVVFACAASGALAQEAYPARAIQIIVPNPPGGMNQITAQPMSAVIEKLYKQPAPVVNKAGATAAVGTAYVATQKPDGYNILVTTPNIYLVVEKNKAQHVDSPYKLEQLQPLALTSADPLILTVQTESPYKTAKDFITDAKAKDGQLAYSSSGPFAVTHVPFAMLTDATGIRMRHVPTTGGGPAVTQLLGGHVQATGQGLAAVAPYIKGGKLRPLASWGAKRHANLPEVPTFKELGYDLEAYLWVGLFTTAGVPEPTLKAMRDLIRRTMNDPMYKQAMEKSNVEIDYRDMPDFVKFFEADHKRLGPVAQKLAKEEKK
ncbi:MAG TPA: tripartite tricarboxylate transporter substrate binding protein [Burkholderiales bacterium]|jgi:tripartite-type tricarboxylate transporter receptor subunit TctC|nr:tripartite tricarboxylate transporter substrate binding protein [Burkholderiales bacterium]